MARFYGWTDEEIGQLDIRRQNMYLRGITILSAEEALVAIKISCAPNLKNNQRSQIIQKLQHQANPQKEGKPMTGEDLERLLNG